ncbi:EcsC family protein [Fodinibius sediminis]|uniref:EcsC protein family protein n=1 Tax=Fodinibius sediminis TaxID=1214077 RepID=A0A521D9E5_9BACT|nr:EcsC family protein [Fodinibius sediminis]SMO68245.1 EcsC protein family protein [Fodinibius sediminis]
MIDTIKNSLLHVRSEEIINKARARDLDVHAVEDFRKQASNYDIIEEMMEDYRLSHARWSAVGGLTTGIGGFTTAVTFAGIDTISLAIQLYRLSERFAILNGFHPDNPLQRDRILNIYFEALGINAVTQATLKHQLINANTLAGSAKASENFTLNLIIRVARIFGRNISSKRAKRLVPVIGGLAGASLNYSFARKTSKAIKEAYKEAYFETWQDESGN